MDFVNKALGNNSNSNENQQPSGSEQKSEGSGGFLGGLGDKLNGAAGGGAEGEKNEDGLDKGETSWSCPTTETSHTNSISKASTSSRRSSSAKAHRTTRVPRSKLRMRRSRISFAASTRVPLAAISPSRTSPPLLTRTPIKRTMGSVRERE